MKRIMSLIVVGSLALGSVAVYRHSSASAATQTATTIKLTNPNAILGMGAATITATTNVAGTVNFTAGTTSITGCAAVVTSTVTPFLATCAWTPAAAGAVSLGRDVHTDRRRGQRELDRDTDCRDRRRSRTGNADALRSRSTSTRFSRPARPARLAPVFGAGCEITNEFIVGQTIVFRVYGNDWSLAGAALSPLNVSSATVTIAGVTAPLALAYGNHGGEAFWTASLKTGTTTGLYSTLGIINYKVSVNTIAVPAVTKKVRESRLVPTIKNGKKLVVNGKVVTHRVSYLKKVIVTPAVAGATGTFVSNFNPDSVATLNALPAS